MPFSRSNDLADQLWVVAQFALILGFLLLRPLHAWPAGGAHLLGQTLRVAGIVVIAIAAVLLVAGGRSLGRLVTPSPRPRSNGQLVQRGAYRIVRHPMYAAVILGALGYALLRLSVWHAVGVLVFLAFFDLKARHEETYLLERYPDYAAYQRRVRKLIPWVY